MVPLPKTLVLPDGTLIPGSVRRRCSISALGRLSSRPRTAVVLSGGEGVRLRPITTDLPKGLVKVGGKPLLQWGIEWLKPNGIANDVMAVAYRNETIMEF